MRRLLTLAWPVAFCVATAAAAAVPVAASASPAPTAPTITYFPTPTQPTDPGSTPSTVPLQIAAGPDGALWFTENHANNIGRIDTSGNAVEYPLPSTPADPEPGGITAGPDDAMWFTEQGTDGGIGRISSTGAVTVYHPAGLDGDLGDIVTGPDGALWFAAEGQGGKIGRMDTSGNLTQYSTPSRFSAPFGIAAGPDGNLWFTETGTGSIGRITPSGIVTEYPVNAGNSEPIGITTGPDGAMWFTDFGLAANPAIGRIDPTTGAIVEYALATDQGFGGNGSEPVDITTGSDGALWFAQEGTDQVGRVTTTGDVAEYSVASPNPASRDAVPAGITTGADGDVWFTEEGGSAIGRITLAAPAPQFTSATSTSAGLRRTFDFKVTTTGAPSATITETGTLPAGVSFTSNGDGTADLSGSAATGTAGSYPLTFTVDDGSGNATTQQFTLTITDTNSAPAFTSSSTVTEAFGAAFTFTISADGYPAPTISKSGTLPAGTTFTKNGDGTATISGTTTGNASGVYPLTLTAKNPSGTTTQSFSLTITKAPLFKSVAARSLTVVAGAAYSLTTSATGYTTPAITESGVLPTGLTFSDNGNGTATIQGTTDAPGSYQVTQTATNPYGTAALTLTLQVVQPPVIVSSPTATATVGQPFTFHVTSTGYPAPKYSLAGTLPRGVKFANATGTFSGTPKTKTAGTYPVTITATNTQGAAQQNFTLTVYN